MICPHANWNRSSVVLAFLTISSFLLCLNGAEVRLLQVIRNQAVRFEAESTTAKNRCIVTDVVPQFSGTGFLDFQGAGSWVEWTINVGTAGNHEITLGFASHNTRPLDLKINGAIKGEYKCEGTGSWANWVSETIVLNLNAGVQTVRVEASRSTGPNVDYLEVRRIGGNQGSSTGGNSGNQGSKNTNNNSKSPMAFQSFPQTTVLHPNNRLAQGEFVSSPSGDYKVGLSNSGDLVLMQRNGNVVWSAGVTGGKYCYMQGDGNLLIRAANGSLKWTAHTSQNPGARLVVDDGGHASVIHGNTPIWLRGIPRGQYTGPSSNSLTFPIRGAFYYPWYPETWKVNGAVARFEPKNGFYSSSDPVIIEDHIDQLEYAHVDLGIASWWGAGKTQDLARISLLMDKTIQMKSEIKWTVYHETEMHEDASPASIKDDLEYLSRWFAWHEAWAHVDGKPVIFVYNEAGCEVANRWSAASNGEWYVVLKLFPGYKNCPIQPDSWHQYGPGTAVVKYDDVSFSVSPGFWRADHPNPKLNRLNERDWRINVQDMVNSRAPWQLITTFNEAGEGTMIESSHRWASKTGYGYYLDALNQIY